MGVRAERKERRKKKVEDYAQKMVNAAKKALKEVDADADQDEAYQKQTAAAENEAVKLSRRYPQERHLIIEASLAAVEMLASQAHQPRETS